MCSQQNRDVNPAPVKYRLLAQSGDLPTPDKSPAPAMNNNTATLWLDIYKQAAVVWWLELREQSRKVMGSNPTMIFNSQC